MTETILSHLLDKKKAISETLEFSDKPGIYALFYIGKDKFPISDFVIPDHQIIYIGKTEKSQKSRDADTHFKTGKTGSSTVRKSIGALLSQTQNIIPVIRNLSDVEKGRTSHYKFDQDSEEIVTQWMTDNLSVAFFEYPKSKEEINSLETDIIRSIYPVLNIDHKNDQNPHKTLISSLRKQLGLIAHSNFINEHQLVGIKREVKEKKIKVIKPNNTTKSTPMNDKNFIIPKVGNSITEADLKKGQIRITVDFKDYFPMKDSDIKLHYNEKSKNVEYKIVPNRSNLLKIGADVVKALNLKAGQRLVFEIVEKDKVYKVNKY